MSEQKPEERDAVKPHVIDLEAEEIRNADEATAFSGEPKRDDETLIAEEVTEGEGRREDTEPREPQVIEDIVADDAERAPPPPPPPPPPSASAPKPHAKKSGAARWIIAALILGVIGGGFLYRGALTDYFPTNAMKAMEARVINLESANKDLAARLDAAAQSAEGLTSRIAGLEEQLKSATAPLADLAGRVDGIDQRVASAEQALAAAKDDLDQFRKSLSAGTGTATTGAPVDNAALAALGQRIDALEKDVASLKSTKGGGDASATAALSQALADLKAKIAAGTGFAEEYDRIARMVPAAPGLDVIGSFARDGLPDAKGLAAELRAAIPALPQPEAPAEEAGSYWDSFVSAVSGIITIREIGEANWPGLAERAAAFAEAGDLPQAIAAIDGAEGAKPGGLSQWRERAAGRLKLEAALAQVSDAVLRQIAALGGQQ